MSEIVITEFMEQAAVDQLAARHQVVYDSSLVDRREALPALAAALCEGRLGGALLDVFEEEPLAAGSVLVDVPKLILTPHIAGLSVEANVRVSRLTATNVLQLLESL